MPLEAGSKLGPYEILAPLGTGGMGEVYLARDEQLGREVAIKTLPASSLGEESRQRFLREARAASALNHPGIVTIHDISRSGEVDYMVMEYVRGRTLSALIGRRGLGVRETIRYALQITDALGNAHAAGIIHRDLKPGNIMVTDDGLVKVLDFGLAKIGETEGFGEPDATRTLGAPTLALTEEGTVVGTVAYMSPEQAEGRRLDARSDIFSLGAVLYEMVTGRRAFTGENPVATMAEILKTDPAPPGQLVQSIPWDLDRIIMRCLRKDPARRFQSLTDLKVDLEELRESVDSGKAAPQAPRRRWPKRPAWAAGALGVLTIVLVLAWMRRPEPVAGPPGEPVPLTTYAGMETNAAFSPDGSQVAFTWNGAAQENFDLYVKVAGSGSPLRLTRDPAADVNPAWSPDGRQIAFLRDGQGVYLIPPVGGSERKLIDAIDLGVNAEERRRGGEFYSARTLAWSSDSKYLAFAEAASGAEPAGIFRIDVRSGQGRRITSADGARDVAPALSPDGRSLVFSRCSSLNSCVLSKLNVDSQLNPVGQVHALSEPSDFIGSIEWMPDGRSLVFDELGVGALTSRLWRVLASGEDKPRMLTFAGPDPRSVAVSRSGGRMAYTIIHADRDLWRMDRGVCTRSPLSSTRNEAGPQFSPDGRRVTFVSWRSGTQAVWVADADGSNAIQLTFSRPAGTPRWSPDGKRIAYDTQGEDGLWDIEIIDSSGGNPFPLVHRKSDDKAPSFSRDGKWVYFASNASGSDEIFRVPVTGGEPVRVTDNGGFVAFESMDGRSIYYTKTPAGCAPLYVRSLKGGPEREVASSVCLRGFTVTKQGIYYVTGNLDDRRYSIILLDPRRLTSVSVGEIEGRLDLSQGLAVSPDGKTVLFAASAQAGADLMLVENYR